MSIKGLHIELTNRCYLKCPLCSRTQFLKQFKQKNWANIDLDFDKLKNFIDTDITSFRVHLVGNYGDPIYHPDIFEFIKFLKSKKAIVNIGTNGSYKDKAWWEELVSIMSSEDTIGFAIDGTNTSFNEYRINGDWESIEQGLTIVGNSKIIAVWRFLPFSFNESEIDQAQLLSKKYNIKNFKIVKSNRFDANDKLQPKNINLSSPQLLQRIEFRKNKQVEITPKCLDNEQHFISSAGFYTPCCFMAEHNFYYKSHYYKNNFDYDITKNKLSTILNKEKNFFDKLLDDKPKVCQYNCPKI